MKKISILVFLAILAQSVTIIISGILNKLSSSGIIDLLMYPGFLLISFIMMYFLYLRGAKYGFDLGKIAKYKKSGIAAPEFLKSDDANNLVTAFFKIGYNGGLLAINFLPIGMFSDIKESISNFVIIIAMGYILSLALLLWASYLVYLYGKKLELNTIKKADKKNE
ncbi:hypothetical protein [Weissella oryzae]|nr:hypothetical protein [Weissella oryzae]